MEKLELNKPRKSVEISNTINLVQRKAFNCLMMQSILIPKPKGQKYHTISIKELCHLTGYKQKDFFYLDKQLEEMQTTLIHWSDSNGNKQGRVQFLGHVFYDLESGILEYSFSDKLVEMVKANKLYNQLDMGSMRELQSKHALALYEFCAGYKETETFNAGTGWRLLSDMKVMLCGDEQAYAQFKAFNRDVLKPAIKEVNENTDITIEMETRKKGRAIHALRFFVKANDNYEDKLLNKPTAVRPPKFGAKATEEPERVPKDGGWKSNEALWDFIGDEFKI